MKDLVLHNFADGYQFSVECVHKMSILALLLLQESQIPELHVTE